MLARKNKLSHSGDILKVLRQGRRLRGQKLGVSYLANGTPDFRCAFVISRKVDNRAAKRNRLRRALSGVIEREALSNLSGQDIVVRLESSKSQIQETKLKITFQKLLAKIR